MRIRSIINHFLALAFLVFVGCSSVEETRLQRSVTDSISRQIQEFNSADAHAVAAARLKEGNVKFLQFFGGESKPSFVPGLSQSEMQRLVDAKKYQLEVFYFYLGRSELGTATEEKALWNARLNYAERVNRELFTALIPEKLIH